ncbi:tetratricopeptide repeat protein [Actinoplanes sp. RD1]|uniref:tetratricopeptide repeat protein n=1 Tax=Actinoplanes sp. RD1 TaxID=3064538 RepID=UPI002741676E|nr:tetratricopeptide repeat protein [Actinoplanes sp. RD1]
MTLPDPGRAVTLDEVAGLLRALKVWAGDPSYEAITGQVNQGRADAERVGRSTVVDCFRSGRKRLDQELVVAVVAALHPEPGYVNQWRQVLRVITGMARAPGQVRVIGELPPELAGFTGRAELIERLCREPGGVTVLRGMAGAGKTQLAVRAGHQLIRDRLVDQVLFVDLRGFHPDRTQPPADPAAVLDGLLRSLGVPGQLVPLALAERVALYRQRLAGRPVLVVLDNAADEEQVAPLLPGAPAGSAARRAGPAGEPVVFVTSRRALAVPSAAEVPVEPFTAEEAEGFLAGALAGLPEGEDPRAGGRIAERCGRLPLALALAAGQMRSRPGWTVTDHADRLDDRHAGGRLEFGVELALDLSYRALSTDGRRLLRMLALHPGSFDAPAAAALAATSPETAAGMLAEFARQHVVTALGDGRHVLHDLVRAFAAVRGLEEDRRADRRAALSRLLDHFLAVAGRSEDAGLDTLVASVRIPVTAHDRPGYGAALSAALHKRLIIRGRHQDALAVHGRAAQEALDRGDRSQHARAVLRIATTELAHSRHRAALEHLDRLAAGGYGPSARAGGELLAGDAEIRLGVLTYRAIASVHLGRVGDARRDLARAVEAGRRAGARAELVHALLGLGTAEYLRGRYGRAVEHYTEGAALARDDGDRWEETALLTNLGEAEVRAGRLDAAGEHLVRALRLSWELGNPVIEASILDALGSLHLARGDHRAARDHYRRSLRLSDRAGSRYGVICSTNGLGHAFLAAGDDRAAIAHYTEAYAGAAAPDVRDAEQQALAQTGLGEAHRRLGNLPEARHHFGRAEQIWRDLNPQEAARVTAVLAAV